MFNKYLMNECKINTDNSNKVAGAPKLEQVGGVRGAEESGAG